MKMAFYCNGKKDYCDCTILCTDCKYYDNSGGKNILTNSEWIRRMTDAELAEFLGHSNLCVHIQHGSTWCEDHGICEGCLEEWLQQPVEVDE